MRLVALVTTVVLAALSSALALDAIGGNFYSPKNKGRTALHPDVGGSTQQSTGTPGHTKVDTTGQKVEVHDQAEAKNRPLLATGEDLQGPTKQFPPSQTPK